MKPSVGRIVHYVSHGTPIRLDGTQAYTSRCRAAIITDVGTGRVQVRNGDGDLVVDEPDGDQFTVGLCVLNPTGYFFDQRVPFHPNAPGAWHWPERVE